MDNFEASEHRMDEITSDVAVMAMELELEVQPEDVTELRGSHVAP